MTDVRCTLCGDKAARSLTAPLTRCPSCCRPCHSKCSGRRKDSPCDLCRTNAPTPLQREAATTTNKRQNNKQNSAQVSTNNSTTLPSQRRTSAPSRTTPPHRESFFSATPAGKRPAQKVKKSARTSQLRASIETDEPVDGAQGLGTAKSTPTKVADVQGRNFALNTSARRVGGAQGPDSAENTPMKVADVQGRDPALNTSARPVDMTQAPFQAQEEMTSHEDCPDLNKNNCDYHPSMRDVFITGAENVIIPVSTLDLSFRRFDMLEKQLDNLKSLENRNLHLCLQKLAKYLITKS